MSVFAVASMMSFPCTGGAIYLLSAARLIPRFGAPSLQNWCRDNMQPSMRVFRNWNSCPGSIPRDGALSFHQKECLAGETKTDL